MFKLEGLGDFSCGGEGFGLGWGWEEGFKGGKKRVF